MEIKYKKPPIMTSKTIYRALKQVTKNIGGTKLTNRGAIYNIIQLTGKETFKEGFIFKTKYERKFWITLANIYLAEDQENDIVLTYKTDGNNITVGHAEKFIKQLEDVLNNWNLKGTLTIILKDTYIKAGFETTNVPLPNWD